MSRPGAWEPGQSGNPKGRPKHSIRAEMQKLAGHRDGDRKTFAQRLAADAWLLAFTKNLDAMKFVVEQVDGKLPTPTPDGDEGRGLRIEIVDGTDA